VTLPDWQGLGLAMALADTLGAAYRGVGKRLHTYPAHPALMRSFDRSTAWALTKRPGFSTSSNRASGSSSLKGLIGARPCAVFEYCGPALERAEAERLIAA